LVKNLVDDLAQLEKNSAGTKLPQDLRQLNMAAFMPSKTVGALRGAAGQFRVQAEMVRVRQESQEAQQSVELEKSIKVRQANLKQGFEGLRKVAPAEEPSVKIIEKRVNETVKVYGRQIEEVQLGKSARVIKVEEKKVVKIVKKPI